MESVMLTDTTIEEHAMGFKEKPLYPVTTRKGGR
jgi:hypothetical protein